MSTLRIVERGWDATGRLSPLWGRVGGRDKLAQLTGITPASLSGYNTGRLGLGITNARRIAKALSVTVFDLGAPEAAVEEREWLSVADRLQSLEDALNELGPHLRELGLRVTALESEVRPRRRRGDSA